MSSPPATDPDRSRDTDAAAPSRSERAIRPSPESSVPPASPELVPDAHVLETLSPESAFQHDHGLGSDIGATPNGLSPRQRRLHRHARLSDDAAQTLRYVLPELKRIAAGLELPRAVAERASHLVREYYSQASFTGASLEEWAGAFVYTASRTMDVYCPRSSLCEAVSVPETEGAQSVWSKVSGCYARIQSVVGLAIPPVSPTDQISSITARIEAEVAPEVCRVAGEVVTRYLDSGGSGSPQGIAAAAMVTAQASLDSEGPSIRALATAADVSERTVYRHRDNMRDICETPASSMSVSV